MDQVTPVRPKLLPALAEKISEWFPELQGRAIAVSEAEITRENIPTLPLVMVAFARSTSDQPTTSAQFSIQMADQIVVEFWLEPSRYKRRNGSETPFWSYYDYETIRNILLSNIIQWQGPNYERFAYRALTIEASPLAVVLTFNFLATFKWCADDPIQDPCQPSTAIDGKPITDQTIVFKICAPALEKCDESFEETPLCPS